MGLSIGNFRRRSTCFNPDLFNVYSISIIGKNNQNELSHSSLIKEIESYEVKKTDVADNFGIYPDTGTRIMGADGQLQHNGWS